MTHSSCYNPSSMGLVERSVRTLKEILSKHGNNLSQLQLSEMVFAVNSREQPNQGSAITRFLGRGIRGALPNSLNRSIDWQNQIQARGEARQNRVRKMERTVGKKEKFTMGENVRLQDLKSKKWTSNGTITDIRTSAERTIASYEIETSDGLVTTRHRKYIQKIPIVSTTHAE